MAGSGEKERDDGKDSLAARRRRIEMRRERQELMALLDDFGDGEIDLDLELLEEDDEEVGRWVAAEEGGLGSGSDDENDADDDEDEDFFDEDYEDED